jgi:hypothetical protein
LAALDPYHDFQYSLEGLPDERSAPSVVQIHNQQVTISIPTSAGTGNWDMGITYTGFNNSFNTYNLMADDPVIGVPVHAYDHASLPTDGCKFGALTYYAGAAGSNISFGTRVAVGDTAGCLGSNSVTTDKCRLIGVAFEIHNTTAEIYKQGSLTVAQLPDAGADNLIMDQYDINAANYVLGTNQSDRTCIFPVTVGALQSVPGSATWPAAKGCYAIPRMTCLPRDIMTYNDKLMSSGTGTVGGRLPWVADSTGASASPVIKGYQTVGALNFPGFSASNVSGFSPIQVFLSGLSPESTITVTFRTIVEYFPGVGSTLLPLATPSPGFDPQAIKLYNEICKLAPIAVPVGQNSAGDYFRKILAIMGRAAILLAPMAGQYSPLVSIAGKAAVAYGTRIDKKAAGPPSMVIKRRK